MDLKLQNEFYSGYDVSISDQRHAYPSWRIFSFVNILKSHRVNKIPSTNIVNTHDVPLKWRKIIFIGASIYVSQLGRSQSSYKFKLSLYYTLSSPEVYASRFILRSVTHARNLYVCDNLIIYYINTSFKCASLTAIWNRTHIFLSYLGLYLNMRR